MTSTELLPCPFCGLLPQTGLTQKRGCQLHGDPIQYVAVHCKNKECPAQPSVKGDVCRYDGGDKPNNHANAKLNAINIWNTRAIPEGYALVPSDKVKTWMIAQYLDFKKRGEIMRHNEEGMEELATILAEAMLSAAQSKKESE